MKGIPGNNSLAGQLNALAELPALAEDAIYDWNTVIDAAMQRVLNDLFSSSPDSVAAFTDLYDQHLVARLEANAAYVPGISLWAFGCVWHCRYCADGLFRRCHVLYKYEQYTKRCPRGHLHRFDMQLMKAGFHVFMAVYTIVPLSKTALKWGAALVLTWLNTFNSTEIRLAVAITDTLVFPRRNSVSVNCPGRSSVSRCEGCGYGLARHPAGQLG